MLLCYVVISFLGFSKEQSLEIGEEFYMLLGILLELQLLWSHWGTSYSVIYPVVYSVVYSASFIYKVFGNNALCRRAS